MPSSRTISEAQFRDLYDQQLRAEAEVVDAPEVVRIGPLWAATFPRRGRGFVTYQQIAPQTDLEGLVSDVVRHFAADDRVDHVEWKTRATTSYRCSRRSCVGTVSCWKRPKR